MDLPNIYNIAQSGTSTRICKDIIQDVFDLIKNLLDLESERAQREMFNQSQYLWYSSVILHADFYLRPGPSIYAGLPNTAVEYKRRGIPLSTLLVNLLNVLSFKFSGQTCCRLAVDVTTHFSSDDFEVIGVLGAFRGKTEFMQVLVKYGYLWTLPATSRFLKQETDVTMLSFMLIVSNFADIHLPQVFKEVMNLLRNTFFCGDEREAIYKRVFFVACALRAVEYSLRNKHDCAEKIFKCLRLYFSVTTDLYLSNYEVKCVLYSCFILLNKLDLFEQYAEEFDKLMPECPTRSQPHSLTHLVRCQVRKNLKFSKLTLPSAIDKLVLPKILKSFILGEDLPRKSGNISLQKPVTKSELAGLLFQRSMI